MKTNLLSFLGLVFLVGTTLITVAAEPTPTDTGGWVNICDNMPSEFQSADMMAVDPTTGNLYLYGSCKNWKSALLISKDQGATWTNIPCPISGGSGGFAFAFNVAYPFTGRMVLFTGDGHAGRTLDGGATWEKFDIPSHSAQYGDVDWSLPTASLMISNSWVGSNGNARSPALSTNGGKTWTIAPPMAGVFGPNLKSGDAKVGIFDAHTVLMSNGLSNGILISHDLGKTWTKTADFHAIGTNPVHYGTKLYWAAAQGVIVTENGSDWTIFGTALPNATCGPYFGKSETEMMVVTDKGIFLTRDAATTWKKISDIPKVSVKGKRATGNRFAWDPIHNLVYEIMGPSVWRLPVQQ